MNIESLRVFNHLNNLKLDNDDFERIINEQKHVDRSGVWIGSVKEKGIIIISHDEKHSIKIVSKIDDRLKAGDRIMFKTLVRIKDLPEEVFRLHSIAQYRSLDKTINSVAKNLETLKDKICDRFFDGYPKSLGEMNSDPDYENDNNRKEKLIKLKTELVKKQLSAIYWLFNEEMVEENVYSRENIARIIKVFSRNNRRVAIIQKNYERNRGSPLFGGGWTERVKKTSLMINCYKPNDGKYNYVCPGREIYLKSYGGEVWICDELLEKVSSEELEHISNGGNDDEWLLLTPDKYKGLSRSVKLKIMSEKRKEEKDKAQTKVNKELVKQFNKGVVERSGIKFSKGMIEYTGCFIKSNIIGKYVVDNRIVLQESPDFNEIFNNLVDYILRFRVYKNDYRREERISCEFEGKEKIVINGININAEKRGNLIYINNFKIVKDDVSKVIKKGLCYNKQKDYDNYLTSCSKVNLTVQNALDDNVITFKLTVDSTRDNCLSNRDEIMISIPFWRFEGKNFVKINNKDLRVKNTPALFEIGRNIDSSHNTRGYLQRSIDFLYKAVKDITPEDIGVMIKEGKTQYKTHMRAEKKKYKEKVEKSKKFLAHAVNITKATKKGNGYFVEGISGNTYYVKTEGLGVYTVVNGKADKYLCIVDSKYNRDEEWEVNDGIAQRLLMLSKDKVVSQEIYDKGDKIDDYWQTLGTEPEKAKIR